MCYLIAKVIESKGIRLEKQIQADGIQIDVVDLGILFGNLLDNAEEAVEKVKGTDKVIAVKVCLELNMVGITVSNTIEGSENHAPDFMTSKRDTRRHGYGMQSIRNIVEKYDGTCEFHIENNKFIAEIQLINEPCKST